ncbi:hypothetical protein [uncultured Kriegella sp.]|uniref:hypothetical protein n=1 Tax=uncultured Kriegella sp. TaxID=1798910 RepID=UPI0030D9C891|tara:strand:- start:176142 stop:176513 length:372 start_codon:yes stop_codon:yes gene_type:complete
MKKAFSFLAIITIISLSNCSRIAENNDPVIGIWTNNSTTISGKSENRTIRSEWIFNDAYLGRYQIIEGGTITTKTDFEWVEIDGVYTITYPGLEKADDIAILKKSSKGEQLEDVDGNVLAIRE